MLQTYKAILRGNQLEWSSGAPERSGDEQPVDVYVTILRESDASAEAAARGQNMADALEKLASINALSEISDHSAWQREELWERATTENRGVS
jgi:hypothetical protein